MPGAQDPRPESSLGTAEPARVRERTHELARMRARAPAARSPATNGDDGWTTREPGLPRMMSGDDICGVRACELRLRALTNVRR